MSSTSPLAVITGAAGGLGTATAHALHKAGYDLVLCDLHEDALTTLAAQLGIASTASLVAGDVTADNYGGRIAAALDGRPISALVHAAGISPTMASGTRIFEVNFGATRRLVEALSPHMAADGGTIVLVASCSAQFAEGLLVDWAVGGAIGGRNAGWTSGLGDAVLRNLLLLSSRVAYPVSKRAVQLYAKAVAPLCGRRGVRVVSVSPGILDTDMGRVERDANPEMNRMIAITPLERAGAAEEIAAVVAFLVSPAASYITGADVLVDGGVNAAIDQAGGPMRALR